VSASPEVYLVGGDEQFRQRLASLLAPKFACRTYARGFDFLGECNGLSPGCIVAGLRLPDMTAFEFMRRLKDADAFFPTVVVGACSVSQVVLTMKAGAVDFLQDPCTDDALLAAVRSALAVESRTPLQRANHRLNGQIFARLTPREHDVLGGVVNGKTNQEIAEEYGISPRTVEVHRANMMLKSGARSISELVRMALGAKHASTLPPAERPPPRPIE
jgi:two-component system response regulator FixJ